MFSFEVDRQAGNLYYDVGYAPPPTTTPKREMTIAIDPRLMQRHLAARYLDTVGVAFR
jgi:hypothetical protein